MIEYDTSIRNEEVEKFRNIVLEVSLIFPKLALVGQLQ